MDYSKLETALKDCVLCPRSCHTNRTAGGRGLCGAQSKLKIARAALHHWEEPCISGEQGSGTVFFSGCTLGCVFCQNYDISTGNFGKEIPIERLAEIFLELQEKGARNINLVTPTQWVYHIIEAVALAKTQGLCLPIVYNSSGYETPETIDLLKDIVDIYLPDFKYMNNTYSTRYSKVKNYSEYAKLALAKMVKQAGDCTFDEDGMMTKGVIVRHLVLPSHIEDSKRIIRYLYETYEDRIFISIMNQYTPHGELHGFPQLARTLSSAEYDEVVDYAIALGVENGFIQEGGTAKESFIPLFDLEGV